MVSKQRGGWGDQRPPFANKMIRTTFLYCKHGDDMMLFIGYMDAFETPGVGGWGGRSPTPFKQNDPHNFLFLHTWRWHDAFNGYMDAFETAGGWEVGGDAAPLFSNKMIRTTFLSCKHVDDMMFFIGNMDCFKTVWGGGLRPPIGKQHDQRNFPFLQTWW